MTRVALTTIELPVGTVKRPDFLCWLISNVLFFFSIQLKSINHVVKKKTILRATCSRANVFLLKFKLVSDFLKKSNWHFSIILTYPNNQCPFLIDKVRYVKLFLERVYCSKRKKKHITVKQTIFSLYLKSEKNNQIIGLQDLCTWPIRK